MSAPMPPQATYRPLQVFPPASQSVTMLVAGDNTKDAPVYVKWPRYQFHRLQLISYLYERGRITETV